MRSTPSSMPVKILVRRALLQTMEGFEFTSISHTFKSWSRRKSHPKTSKVLIPHLLTAKAKLPSRTKILCVVNAGKKTCKKKPNRCTPSVPASFWQPSKTDFCDVLVRKQSTPLHVQTSAAIVRNAVCADTVKTVTLPDPCPEQTTQKLCSSVRRNFRGQDQGNADIDPEIEYRFDSHCDWIPNPSAKGKPNSSAGKCQVTNRHSPIYETAPVPTSRPTPLQLGPIDCTDITDPRIQNELGCRMEGCEWYVNKKKKQAWCSTPRPCEQLNIRADCNARNHECKWIKRSKAKGKFCQDITGPLY